MSRENTSFYINDKKYYAFWKLYHKNFNPIQFDNSSYYWIVHLDEDLWGDDYTIHLKLDLCYHDAENCKMISIKTGREITNIIRLISPVFTYNPNIDIKFKNKDISKRDELETGYYWFTAFVNSTDGPYRYTKVYRDCGYFTKGDSWFRAHYGNMHLDNVYSFQPLDTPSLPKLCIQF